MTEALAGPLRASARLVRIAGLAATTLARANRAGPGRRAAAAVLAEASRAALAVHGLAVEASGPTPAGPALLVANHLSYLDPVVLAACADCVPISRADLAGWPVLGTVARRTGVLFVERGSARSRREVLAAADEVLRDGALLLNFPEGTTTDGSTVLPFRKGLFGVARDLALPVVPAALSYAPRELAWVGDATFVPHYLRLATLARPRVRVAFGQPIPSRAHPTAGELAAAARGCVLDLLEDRTACLRKAR